MGHRAWHTFAKLPVLALINDLKKKFWKKLYVTIPQWSEAFRNMSHLRSGWNRAKCGLQLNDPIDCFKLRLNQPKRFSGEFPGIFHSLQVAQIWIKSCRIILGKKQKSSTCGLPYFSRINTNFPRFLLLRITKFQEFKSSKEKYIVGR